MVTAYLKQQCGWSRGVREVLGKYEIEYEEKQIHNPEHYQEMILKSGQTLQPTLVINNKVLPDVSGEELETYLIENGYEYKENTSNVPLDRSCTDEEHEQMRFPKPPPIKNTIFNRGF